MHLQKGSSWIHLTKLGIFQKFLLQTNEVHTTPFLPRVRYHIYKLMLLKFNHDFPLSQGRWNQTTSSVRFTKTMAIGRMTLGVWVTPRYLQALMMKSFPYGPNWNRIGVVKLIVFQVCHNAKLCYGLKSIILDPETFSAPSSARLGLFQLHNEWIKWNSALYQFSRRVTFFGHRFKLTKPDSCLFRYKRQELEGNIKLHEKTFDEMCG